ncbi:copper uptake system-associated protein [Chitinimonas koreensis]|uniref:copper uptake system-associated protein n=1 Tax=Chitinimonas koreensis TaxID=356302 RepID=UPI000428CB62|nr:copper uptake system-associated protein [Chitinimonas koreensis]QNM95311.1 copper uptake system-associated protein [Chitinimonas koreensis]
MHIDIHRALAAGLLAAALSGAAIAGDPAQDIRDVIGRTYDKPDAKVDVAPVVVEQDYAVAGWLQGERGGRALLRQQQGQWQILLCAGDGLRSADGLVNAGVPAAVAQRLAARLGGAEKGIDASRLHLFSLFGNEGGNASHHAHP